MPAYVLNRNYLLRTTDGVAAFEKGVPCWIVPEMEKHAVAVGAERIDGLAPDPLGASDLPKLPIYSADERTTQIIMVFEQLIARNDSKDFTAQGVPTVKAVEKLLSFDVERAELIELWTQMKIDKAEAAE